MWFDSGGICAAGHADEQGLARGCAARAGDAGVSFAPPTPTPKMPPPPTQGAQARHAGADWRRPEGVPNERTEQDK